MRSKCQKGFAHTYNNISIRGAGESSAHLWISHLPHAPHQSTRINIFIHIKIIREKSSSVAKHAQQPAPGGQPRCESDVAPHFRALQTGPFRVRFWSSAPPYFRQHMTDTFAQVQRAARCPLDKPELRGGDGGIAPPVLVPGPELRLTLTAGLHRAAAPLRITRPPAQTRWFCPPSDGSTEKPARWLLEERAGREGGGHYFNVVSKDKKM